VAKTREAKDKFFTHLEEATDETALFGGGNLAKTMS
jgi:hypothetical protein